jgi:DNA repair protein RadB
MEELSPNTEVISALIGHYIPGHVTAIYGPASVGKTTCCLLASIQCAKEGFKAVYIDSENGFSPERFEQLSGGRTDLLNNLFVMKVNSFSKQQKTIEKLDSLAGNEKVKLVIIDTIGNHYRIALKKDAFLANRYMSKQLEVLSNIAAKGKIVIIANQVYQNIDKFNEITMVGGNMIKNKADCLLELEKQDDRRIAVLKKHYANIPVKRIGFEIKENGIYSTTSLPQGR